ncbi:MAG: hypothetical protein II628_15870, partial [Lachnospiraceae bacterium]|nr:hypothetical protein [Lachnospiraceae bacterium]
IVDEVKKVLVETADMTDEELGEQIRSIAAGYHVNLTDYQAAPLSYRREVEPKAPKGRKEALFRKGIRLLPP